MVEAWIGQFQPQNIFPINAATDHIHGLAVGQPFRKLEDRGQRHARRRFCWLAAPWEEGAELRVVVDVPETVGDMHIDIAMRECGMGNPLGGLRDRVDGVGVWRHQENSFPMGKAVSGKKSYRNSGTTGGKNLYAGSESNSPPVFMTGGHHHA